MSIDLAHFKSRLRRLLSAWKEDEGGAWTGFHTVVVSTGKRQHDIIQYLKSVAFHQWLFGLEVNDVTVIINKESMRILTVDGKKADVLATMVAPAKEVGVDLQLIKAPRGSDLAPICKEAIAFARSGGGDGGIGGLVKLKQAGTLYDAFAQASQDEGLQVSDAGLALGFAIGVNDTPASKQTAKKSGFFTSSVMNFAQKRIEEHVEKGKPVRHSKLSDVLQDVMRAPQKADIKLRADNCDYAYLPVIASGGQFQLRAGVGSDDSKLHDGVVLLHVGGKYSNVCTNACRTLFFNPGSKQEAMYEVILAAQKAGVAALVPGATLGSVHAAVLSSLKASAYPELADKAAKHFGYGIGLELRDGSFVIKAGSAVRVLPGMAFNVCVGAPDLVNPEAKGPKDKTYAIQVADTVLVQESGSPEVMTRFSASAWKDVSYVLKDDDDDEADIADELDDLDGSPHQARENIQDQNLGRGRRNANRAAETAEHQAALAERQAKQAALSKKKTEETYRRLTTQANKEEGTDSHMRSVTDVKSYESHTHVPPQRNLLVTVDPGSESLLVPVMGVHVPLHITTVKGISYSQDGEANDKVHSYVRIQFHCTGAYDARQAFPAAAFIKELSFRSAKPDAAQKFVQEAQAMRRQVLNKDKEAAERATLVRQDKLQRVSGRQPFKLVDVWIFPAISARKRLAGSLEAHQNGLRYVLQGGDHLDIMYSNIRHAFFQEAEKELVTILHFNLKHPIMVGKKKATDVQIYTEVMGDTAAALDGRRNMYDPDELEEEQRERERRKRINMEFKRFTKRVQEAWDRDFSNLKLEWDLPYRDLAFQGNTGKSTVTLMPTVHCLVQLVEPPYTVVALSDIEIVNLERVGFNGKTFDMVVVYKDFTREVGLIGSIPTQSLEDIKNWLTTQEIKFYESKLNLSWKQILKTIIQDPDRFVADGGWDFLSMEGSEGEEEEDEASDDFRPSSDDGESEADDDSGEEESVVDSENESADFSEDSEMESGKDWDELEDEARRADKLRTEEDEAESKKAGGKRKAAGPPSRGAPAAKRRH